MASTNQQTPFKFFQLRKSNDHYALCSRDGTNVAVLDVRTTLKLDVLKSTTVRFDAVVEANIFSKSNPEAGRNSMSFSLSINIFGLKSMADDMASQLAKVSAFLQHPKMLPFGVQYYNPQYFTFPEETLDMNEFVTGSENTSLARNMKILEEVGNILDSLADVAFEPDPEPVAGLTTKLER